MSETITPLVVPKDEAAAIPTLDDPALYINREMSWLEFNRRVLEEALDPSVPLLERIKFLAIFASNLDEFFMVRVGGLQQKVGAGVSVGSGADRMAPRDQLAAVSHNVREMFQAAYACFNDQLRPTLEKENILIRAGKDVTEPQKTTLGTYFRRDIFPVLTPLAIDQGHPFPHLFNKSLNLAVMLRRPRDNEQLFAVVQVPAVLPRFVQQKLESGYLLIPLETLIRMHLPDLFPGMNIEHTAVFRVTRNSEYEIDDDDVEDLLKTIEEEVRKRRRGFAVRLEIETNAHPDIANFMMQALDLDTSDVYSHDSFLDMTGLFQVYSLPGYPHLRDPQFVPQTITEFSGASSIFSAIRTRDILLHHPFDSFGPVIDFIETAAKDERVLAIKQTLYRTSSDSSIVKALQLAADNGKQVTAVIELKARLDEERNIQWARQLEKSGVHVVFGFVGLKTHCKVALVVRREDDGIRRYVHLGTGNYNQQTARLYTDLGFFTCNNDFCDDASALFNYLTGYSELPHWRKLVVAPSRMQAFMIERIENEASNAHAGRLGRIIVKINGLLEPAIIQALYRASQAGVKIDIICRGICALRPGIRGVSENIRVISIIDRFLEHSRIFHFHNGGDAQVYVGSADWMDRNLSRRVEVVFPVENLELKNRLVHEILAICLSDNTKARELLPDGTYRRVTRALDQPAMRCQDRFLDLAAQTAQRQPHEPITPPVSSVTTPAKTRTRGKRGARKEG